ncbi:hypothetical protein KFE25_013626 [Diacronema lutheri]|uniref:Uncharacterized protein n=1 Tax=Diacronema lutheri TaxID=2081491 RepID=A0A8J5XJ09_DIALT|nr:hypothetical protein KFE25_013626 [Diacronema lutheri]
MAANAQARARIDKAAQLASECAHALVNEPSLGAYYVMEHVERSVPIFVECKRRLADSRAALAGASADASFDRDAVQMAGASTVSISLAEIRAEIARHAPPAESPEAVRQGLQ